MHYTRLFLLAMGGWLAACTPAAHMRWHPEQKLAPAQLQEDLTALEHTLKRNHPSLYWYSSPAQVDSGFALARSRLSDSLTELQFKNIVAEALQPIRCGHTSVRSSVRFSRFYRKHPRPTFPLSLKITDDSTLVVTHNRHRYDTVLKRGTVVTAIDGHPADRIIDTLRLLVPIDGYAVNFAYQNISNNFAYYYQNRFGTRNSYLITYRNDQGVADTLTVRAFLPVSDSTTPLRLTQAERTPPVKRPTPAGEGKLWVDSTRRYAVMTLNSFDRALRRHFFRSSFRSLRKQHIPHLIIDVRNNGGGLIKQALLLTRYLQRQPFVFMDSAYAKVRQLRGEARILQRDIYNVGMLLSNRRVHDSLFAFRYFRSRMYQPKRLAYRGKVWLLTGGYTFSAASFFTAHMKGLPHVTLVGEETGGAYYGNNGIFIPDIRLPHSRLRVRLPVYRIVTNKHHPHDGRGVLPDVEVKPTHETIRRNSDPKLEKVIELINEQMTARTMDEG